MASLGSARVGTLLQRIRSHAPESPPSAAAAAATSTACAVDLGEQQILWIDELPLPASPAGPQLTLDVVDVIAHPSAWQSTLPNGRIVIAEEFEDGGMWDLWWFPAGSEHGTLRRVRTVDDVTQVADELGFDPDTIRWETTALKDIMRPDLAHLNVSR